MTRKTAERLNRLRTLAQPITLCAQPDTHDVATFHVPDGGGVRVWNVIKSIWLSLETEANAESIRRAARDRTEAETGVTSAAYGATLCGLCDHGANPIAWELGKNLIMASIEAENARSIREYEAYRVACEQGIALPPTE